MHWVLVATVSDLCTEPLLLGHSCHRASAAPRQGTWPPATRDREMHVISCIMIFTTGPPGVLTSFLLLKLQTTQLERTVFHLLQVRKLRRV